MTRRRSCESRVLKRRAAMVSKRDARRRAGGFTLIELMVTLAIGVLLMVVAVPSFVQFRKNADLSDAVSSFVMATNLAKSAALRTGRNTYLVPDKPTLGWSAGWYVYVDSNFNGTFDAAEQKIIEHDALSPDITVTTPLPTTSVTSTLRLAPAYLLYSGSGYPQQVAGGLAAGIIVMATTVRSSTVIVDTTGRARSCKTLDAGCSL